MRLCPAPPLTLLTAACGAVTDMGLTGGGSATDRVRATDTGLGTSIPAPSSENGVQLMQSRTVLRGNPLRQKVNELKEVSMISAQRISQRSDCPCATDTQGRDPQTGTPPQHLARRNLPVPIGQGNQGIATGHSDPRLSKPRIIKRIALPYCHPCTADDVSESLAKNLRPAMKDALRNTAMAELMRKRD